MPDNTSSRTQLRTARVDDTHAIRSLMSRSITQDVKPTPDQLPALLKNVNANLDAWLAEPASCLHLLALHGESVIGVVMVKDCWNLCSLFVDSAWQGQGIGRQLLEEAALLCIGKSPKQALWLNAAGNAIAFYRKLGFVERQSTQTLPPGFLAMQRHLPALQSAPGK